MSYPIVIAAIFCGWAMLRIMGNQRQRQIQELEQKLRTQAAESSTETPPQGAENSISDGGGAVRSKAGR